MKFAADTFHTSPYYRRDLFRKGLERLGYSTGYQPSMHPEPSDVLLLWNRSPHHDIYAKRYEAVGAKVIVAENGYIGSDSDGHILYAMALRHHNGAGDWRVGDEDRWAALGISLEPWRGLGTEIVVLPQRGIGEPGIAMPSGWTNDVVQRLRSITDRPVRVRPHPGKDKTDPRSDLINAWAAVTWASGAGIKAIVAGVPMFHEMPTWVGAGAALSGIDRLETPFKGDRLPMLRRLAWSQWNLAEIQRGDPFAWLLA